MHTSVADLRLRLCGFCWLLLCGANLWAQPPAESPETAARAGQLTPPSFQDNSRSSASAKSLAPSSNVQSLQIDKVCFAASEEMKRRGVLTAPPQANAAQPGAAPTGVAIPADAITFSDYQDAALPAGHGSDSHFEDNDFADADESSVEQLAIDNIHANCFAGIEFPSASKCQACHPGHYREWSVSPHAYAQLSPVFNAMSNKLISLNNGTLGDFCIRCHTPVGMARNQPIAISNLDRPPVEREGVTCVVCHRVNQNWGKITGRQALVGGGLDRPIYGPMGNDVLREALSNPERFGVLNPGPQAPTDKSRQIHRASKRFFALTTPAMCGSCHDVFAPNGFRLEDAFSEFKASPAARVKHQSCQDCHMGQTPGKAEGYACEPAAIVGNASTPPRKRTNHMMIGPDYSIVHPGLFPHNPQAIKEEYTPPGELSLGLATPREWLQFDVAAGWGEEEFERELSESAYFPPAWHDASKRIRARLILDDQFELLGEAAVARHDLLSTGYRLGDIQFVGKTRSEIHFKINVSNGTDGHGVPTGFDAERLVFLRVTICDSHGRVLFVSGDLDPNGDIRDSHSLYVHNGLLPVDQQLFSLQTRFLTRNVRGGEREQVLNVPFSLDPLPYTRPETRPFTVLGRTLGARKHKQNIEVGGHRWAEYSVKRSCFTGNGPFYARVDLVAGMVPVNLIHAISSAGFDYGMSARQVADAVVAGHVIVHSRQAKFYVDK